MMKNHTRQPSFRNFKMNEYKHIHTHTNMYKYLRYAFFRDAVSYFVIVCVIIIVSRLK